MHNLASYFKEQSIGGLAGLLDAAPGFTFKIGDLTVPQDAEILSEDKDGCIYTCAGAKIAATYEPDNAHNAIIYGISITNISNSPLRLYNVCPLDIILHMNHKDIRVHSFYGGNIEMYYPPENFSETEIMMCPSQRFPDPLWEPGYRLSSSNGRSSDNDMAIAILEDKGHTGGLYLGIIWSGDWYMEFFKRENGDFRAFGGMQFLDLMMEPGETVTLPQILAGAYTGDYDTGANAVRRYIYDNYINRFPENKRIPPVSYDHWFGLGVDINDEIMKKQADRLDGFGIEYFVMDAGWYYNDAENMNDFHYGTGNFTRVDERKFPNGLRPLYDYLKSKGLKGGLWFEPERAGPASIIANELPEAMLKTDKAGDVIHRSDLNLVDLGNPKAVEYTKKYLKHYFEDLGLEWIRWDFNINPRNYWADHDRSGRRGETELAHIHGLYELLEWINREYPNVLIEGCASGGQRMDLGTMKHSPVFWCSDQTFNAHINRWQLAAGNRILPGIIMNRALTPRLPKGNDIPDIDFQSLFGGSFAINDPVQYWSEETRGRCIKHIGVYKKLREFLCRDYYQLLPLPKNIEDPMAWEFIDPERQKGFFQLFRTEGEENITVRIKGLTGTSYTLIDPYTGRKTGKSVTELKAGITFGLEPYSSAVYLFEQE